MTESNRGIVLQQLRYGDSSLIVKVFTEERGIQHFIVKGAFGKSARLKPALFQPLSLVEIQARYKPGRDLNYLTEVNIESPGISIASNIVKSSIGIYISELLSKCIMEGTGNPSLFNFVHEALEWLELSEGPLADFHLYFTLELSRHLGFYPKTDKYREGSVFDLMSGEFTVSEYAMHHYIPVTESVDFYRLCQLKPNDFGIVHFGREKRQLLLNHLINYYRIHLPGFDGLKSVEVLKVLLSPA